ncbi:MAG TPA: hypothetical protein VFF79_07670 [Conexibacter sp.]|jgi:hypothetical protein|nr:hypothetical protein [Conexibacter sp.]
MSATTGHVEQPAAPAGAGAGRARALTPAELAWIALIPCTIVTLAAIVVLGPPLAHVLFQPGSDSLWPPGWWEARGRPEPVKHARYALALLGPLLLAAAVLWGTRRRLELRPRTIRAVTLTAYALLLAFTLVAALGQHDVILGGSQPMPKLSIFGVGALVAAAALLAGALVVLRRDRVAQWIGRVAAETPRRHLAGLAIAASFTALWVLETVTTDRLVEDHGQMNWTLNDVFAVLDGRTPLVDYHMLYGKLLPYPAALVLAVLGTTGFVYTLLLTVLNGLALLAVYAIFRRIVRSSLLALALFVPFVAAGDIGHTMHQAGLWPMRYGGTYLLAWLTVRHLDRASPRRAWILFLVGGLTAINSMEFGLGALLATLAALLCARPPRGRRDALRLAGECAGGALGAVAVVSAFTLLRAGALPDPALLMEWPRIFTTLGWFALPVPGAGLHLAVYATFAAAIAVAAVRVARMAHAAHAARAGDDVLLTSMLMWSGVFGLVAGSYYVGRAEDVKLLALFSAWAFALALLTIVTARALAARGWRRPTLPQLLLLFGFALAICSVVHVPAPWGEISRLTQQGPAPTYRAAAENFVRERTQRGEKVAILLPEGHRIAYDLGLDNVSPFGIQNAVVTRVQMATLIETIRREGVTEIFVPSPSINLAGEGNSAPAQLQLLAADGYPATSAQEGFVELRRGA